MTRHARWKRDENGQLRRTEPAIKPADGSRSGQAITLDARVDSFIEQVRRDVLANRDDTVLGGDVLYSYPSWVTLTGRP